ncbi:WXG100 family type VII secretion target [Streptomyces boninensis]|uniref:WXG100 family type VII secretion target n=1 Tax=Streptomyces boninensis TaxID=2039455 RepID=UPI003B227D9E
MGDGIKADLKVIRACSRALYRIHRQFKDHGNPADGYMSDLGYEGLRDAFDDFNDTWKKTRGKLVDELEELAKFTEKAADGYDRVDTKLANALRKAAKEG